VPNWMIYIIDGVGLIVIFACWVLFERRRIGKLVKGSLLAEFWQETGRRYKKIRPIESNGIEIKAPNGHRCPRYFFSRETVGHTMYPESPFLGITLLQHDVPIVSWAEDNPEPICPHEHPAVATSSLIGSVTDDDFAAFAIAANQKIKALEEQLIKAIASKINPMVIYVGLTIVAVIGIIGAYFAYGDMNILKNIANMFGISVK
jgi:hypothetical protein